MIDRFRQVFDNNAAEEFARMINETSPNERFGVAAQTLLGWIAAGTVQWGLPQLLDQLKSCW